MKVKRLLLVLCALLVPMVMQAQTPAENVDKSSEVDDEVFVVVEQDAEFPGGLNALEKYLTTNIQYPKKAVRKNIQGKVFVKFVIEKDGSISNIKILRSPDELLSKEAERVVKAMPKWEPAKQQGKPVRFQFILPVNFRLK